MPNYFPENDRRKTKTKIIPLLGGIESGKGVEPKNRTGGVFEGAFSDKKVKKIDSTCFWAILGSKMSIFELI